MGFDYTYTPEEHRTIAQEGIQELIAAGANAAHQVKQKLLEVFPSMLQGFSGREKLAKLPEFITSNQAKAEFVKHLQTTHYAELKELRAFTPEGLSVTYLQYAKTMLAASTHLKTIVPDTINPYVLYLAHLMSNKGKILSTESHAIEYDRLEHNRTELYASLNTCYTAGKYEVETVVGKVVENNAQWMEVFNTLDTVMVNLRTIDREKVRELTKQCDEYMAILFNLLREGKMDQITPEVGETLTRGCFAVAQELELLSIVYYRAIAFDAAVERTLVKLNEILA